MLRSLSLLGVLIVCGLCLSACGHDTTDESAESRMRQQEAVSRQRAERIAELERRLAKLKARERATGNSEQSAARLASAFDNFASSLQGSVGATLGPPGLTRVEAFGDLSSGLAWSTIKVPIALRVLEGRGGPSGLAADEQAAIERALIASDNSAAAKLFHDLGDTSTAATAVEQVLREAGDSTQVSTVGRGSFSPYGQTDWPLSAQHRFMAALSGGCISGAASRRYLLDLMGRVTSDLWGLGSVGLPARWKGGWGPGSDGSYLARQMGVVDVRGRYLVVTLAAMPTDGSFATAQSMATEVARWLAEHGARFAGPVGRC